ncbi:MAG: class IV adenylate cyclase [Anaerolineales bacterium]
MSSSDQELEVKFYLSKRREMEAKLNALGQLSAPRVHEINLRLDTAKLSLLASGKLLRLRQDSRVRVTYKGPGSEEGGVRLRQELEFTVSDFDTARALFEALGYQVYMMYEKYRTTYQLKNVEVALDEMPTGDFLEIEGPDSESIRNAAQQLELTWETRILDSYTVLFARTRAQMGFDFRDLSFENFKGMSITPQVMGIMIADQH